MHTEIHFFLWREISPCLVHFLQKKCAVRVSFVQTASFCSTRLYCPWKWPLRMNATFIIWLYSYSYLLFGSYQYLVQFVCVFFIDKAICYKEINTTDMKLTLVFYLKANLPFKRQKVYKMSQQCSKSGCISSKYVHYNVITRISNNILKINISKHIDKLFCILDTMR